MLTTFSGTVGGQVRQVLLYFTQPRVKLYLYLLGRNISLEYILIVNYMGGRLSF